MPDPSGPSSIDFVDLRIMSSTGRYTVSSDCLLFSSISSSISAPSCAIRVEFGVRTVREGQMASLHSMFTNPTTEKSSGYARSSALRLLRNLKVRRLLLVMNALGGFLRVKRSMRFCWISLSCSHLNTSDSSYGMFASSSAFL